MIQRVRVPEQLGGERGQADRPLPSRHAARDERDLVGDGLQLASARPRQDRVVQPARHVLGADAGRPQLLPGRRTLLVPTHVALRAHQAVLDDHRTVERLDELTQREAVVRERRGQVLEPHRTA